MRTLGGDVDEVFAVPVVAGLSFLLGAATLLTALPFATALTTVRIRANDGTLGVGRFGDGFFALLNLRGKSGLRRSLRSRRTSLSAVNLGRVLRGGQVCQL